MDASFRSFPPLNDAGGKIWLNYIQYAKRLLGENGDGIWLDPARFLALFSQSQGLLKSDVLGVPIFDFYSVYLNSHPEIAQHWTGKKTPFALRKLLALEKPRDNLIEVLRGLTNLYDDHYPIVLEVPSPRQWMAWLKEIEAPGSDLPVSSNEIDSATMYLADLLRNFSQAGLTGIVLDESRCLSINLKELYELYQPIFNIARHYQWVLGLRLGEDQHLEDIEKGVDFVLYEGKQETTTDSPLEQATTVFGGLDKEFWKGECTLENKVFKTFSYGTIPEDAHPERVLEQLQELRSR